MSDYAQITFTNPTYSNTADEERHGRLPDRERVGGLARCHGRPEEQCRRNDQAGEQQSDDDAAQREKRRSGKQPDVRIGAAGKPSVNAIDSTTIDAHESPKGPDGQRRRWNNELEKTPEADESIPQVDRRSNWIEVMRVAI
jgi:hypothetical protein